MSRGSRDLARSLLETVVCFTEMSPIHPDSVESPPIERPFQLGELLTTKLPGVLFLGAEDDVREMTNLYGESGETIAPRFARLCSSLFVLKRTGQTNRTVIADGKDVLDLLIAGVQSEEHKVREQLRKDYPANLDIARMGEKHFSLDFNKILNDFSIINYGRFLDLNLARTALELMRKGVDAILQCPPQNPSLPPQG